MSKYGSKVFWDCTECCKSFQHSRNLIAAVTKRCLNDKQIAAYLYETCCNFAKIQDDFGRTTLHIAASCGRLELCIWLAAVAGADVNARDWESGYTALQRSIFYGNIDVAVRLIQIGADLSVPDKEDISPLELVSLERLPEVRIPTNVPSQVYVWGSNLNFTLGTGTDNSRKQPELLDYFKRNNISIKQVCTDEYHSVFVSSTGEVWVCGHGQGGRLGIYKEKPLLIPTLLSLSNEQCLVAATALNHTLLLLGNGSVLAFGSNQHHQLGITPNSEACLSPKHVNLSNARSIGPITGICAAKFHSVFYNENAILVCGLNAGQLGYKTDNLYITVPQQIPVKDKIPVKIKNVATSIGSIVYSLSNGDVFIVHRFQFKKIATRLLGIEKIVAFGGHLNAETISELGENLKVFILTSKGTVIFWDENVPNLMKCSYGLKKSLVVCDIFLNESHLLFTNANGEAFQGCVKDKESFQKTPDDSRKRHSGGSYKNEKITKSNEKLGKCVISAKRIPHIHRAISITSDPKGKNFAVIQGHPNNSVDLTLVRSPSEMIENLATLFLDASEDDTVHDIVFNVKGTKIAAHCYVLAVNGFPLDILHDYYKHKNGDVHEVLVNDSFPIIFKEFLMYLYSGHCQLLKSGPCDSRFTTLPEDPLKLLNILAKRYEIVSLISKLETLRYDNGQIISSSSCIFSEKSNQMHRNLFSEFYDVELQVENGKIIKAHKCILTARLPYFSSMFMRGWSETKSSQTIHLQTSVLIAQAFIDFLYTDQIPDYINGDDLDNVIRLLILSDQLLAVHLKEACEVLLAQIVNLKNCVSILQVCSIYNTISLKEPVIRFIVQNLNALLESKVLESLSDQALLELTEYYKKYNRYCDTRIITPYSDSPCDEDILSASASVPEPFFILPEIIKDVSLNKSHKINTQNSKKKISKKLSFHQSPEVTEEYLPQIVPETSKDFSNQEFHDENIQFFDNSDFPSLSDRQNSFNSNNKSVSFRLRGSTNSEPRRITPPTLSQKQRKKKSVEIEEEIISSPPKTQFKGWAVIPPLNESSILNFDEKKTEPNLFEIISNEQKEKHNWMKMKSKPFHLTQMEDAAMDDLITFYNANNVFDERITVERVLPLNIAKPVWIPGHKKKAYEEF
ncbi:hypothetical protein O3M35_008859 [Rhynocoris fuscipes]|uniref:BTB domain-containing protein n=1 Tax=Rhynocoris fuscipes TaxID=488301 RepID=A0AAW1D7S1_9HEMI